MMLTKKKHCDGPCDSDQYIWKNSEGKKYCKNCWGKKTEELTRSGNRVKPTEKEQYRIPLRSSKKVKEDALYTVMRKVFLDQHPMCMAAITGKCTQTATDIQHKKGRGEYFLDTTTWMSLCRSCHSYIDVHPEEAIEKGWAELRLTPKENG